MGPERYFSKSTHTRLSCFRRIYTSKSPEMFFLLSEMFGPSFIINQTIRAASIESILFPQISECFIENTLGHRSRLFVVTFVQKIQERI